MPELFLGLFGDQPFFSRAQRYIGAMHAALPATWAAFAFGKFGVGPADVVLSRGGAFW